MSKVPMSIGTVTVPVLTRPTQTEANAVAAAIAAAGREAPQLREDVPLLDVRPGMHITIVTTVAVDSDGEVLPPSADCTDGTLWTGPVSGHVVSIRPINPTQTQGFELVLDTGMSGTVTLRVSRYNRDVTAH